MINFNSCLVKKIVISFAKTIPGVRKIDISSTDINVDESKIQIHVWFKKRVINICSVSQELQKKIFFNLSQQLDNPLLKINLIIHA